MITIDTGIARFSVEPLDDPEEPLPSPSRVQAVIYRGRHRRDKVVDVDVPPTVTTVRGLMNSVAENERLLSVRVREVNTRGDVQGSEAIIPNGAPSSSRVGSVDIFLRTGEVVTRPVTSRTRTIWTNPRGHVF